MPLDSATETSVSELPLVKAIRLAYLGHLFVPAAIVLDRVVARSWGQRSAFDALALPAGVIWIVAALALLGWAWKRRRVWQKLAGPLLSFYAVVFCLGVAELGLRVIYARSIFHRQEFLYPPGSRWVVHIDSRETPGVAGDAVFSVNELGLRGPAVPGGGTYRMITVGGSTTECLYLDDSEEWPNLTMQFLNASARRTRAWVSNAGVGGHTSVDNLRFLQVLPALRQAEMLIFLEGVNDMAQTLFAGGAASQPKLEAMAARNLRSRFVNGHLFFPDAWVDRLLLYQFGRIAIGRPPHFLLRHSDFGFLGRMREARASGRTVPLPSLETGLAEYAQRIKDICGVCRDRNVRCLFVTQPSVWRDNLPPEVEALLWFGYTAAPDGREGFVSSSQMAQAMDQYNRVLLRVARESGAEAFDLAAAVPKDPKFFHDDCHFTEAGARAVAGELAAYLAATRPFSAE
jgi:lysophospholipase L1-like esterase